MRFSDRTVLVTGGANGIGKAVADRFREEGADVIVFDREEPSFECRFFEADVRDEAAIRAAFTEIESLDVLVNNAGVYLQASVEETAASDLDRVIDTNLKGYYLVSKHALPLLREQNGCIVNVSSGLGEVPEPASPAYCASKAGINMLTQCMAQQHADDTVRVNAVLPGPIDTRMLQEAFDTEEELDAYRRMNPMREIAEPEDVAAVVCFLASDRADYVTGSLYAVDGGESSSSLYSR